MTSARVRVHFDGSMTAAHTEVFGGAVVYHPNGQTLCFRTRQVIAPNTNNVGEWLALILALRVCTRLGLTSLHIHGDSALILSQVQGGSIKQPHFKPLNARAQRLLQGLDVVFTHVFREDNRLADRTATSYRLLARGRKKPLFTDELFIDADTGQRLDGLGQPLGPWTVP
jgi:ribonuclease HI